MKQQHICLSCDGKGEIQVMWFGVRCAHCDGTGKMELTNRIRRYLQETEEREMSEFQPIDLEALINEIGAEYEKKQQEEQNALREDMKRQLKPAIGDKIRPSQDLPASIMRKEALIALEKAREIAQQLPIDEQTKAIRFYLAQAWRHLFEAEKKQAE